MPPLPAPTASTMRRFRLAYATAFAAAIPLALLDGAMAALVGTLSIAQPLDLVRFALFLLGCYAGVALLLATLEIPFVMLLRASADADPRSDRAAKGYAATVAIVLALAPLQPLAALVQERFARTSYAGLGLALMGVGLALLALLAFAAFERAFSSLLRRATGPVGRAFARPSFALLLPVAVVAGFVALLAGRVLAPDAREAVHLAATAIGLVATQGALALLAEPAARRERLAPAGLAVTLVSVFAIGSLGDAALRAPDGDAAVEATSHQTLLGAYMLPPIRLALRGPDRGPAIFTVREAHRRTKRPTGRDRAPVAPTDVFPPVSALSPAATSPPAPAVSPSTVAVAAATRAPAVSAPIAAPVPAMPSTAPAVAAAPASPAPPAASPTPSVSPKASRNFLFVTFDAFDPRVMTIPEAGALQEIAARSAQAPIALPQPASRALTELWRAVGKTLVSGLTTSGYTIQGFEAWNARGRGGRHEVRATTISGSGRRNAADEAILRVRRVLQEDRRTPWLVWLHLPGPTGSSETARRAAAKRASIRLRWLLDDLEKRHLDDKTIFVLVGLAAQAGEPAMSFLAEPGGAGSRGAALTPNAFGERLRLAAGGR